MKRACLFIFISALVVNVQVVGQTPQKHQVEVKKDVLFASPEGFDLTMDIYTPQTGKSSYPVLVIIHGGGWLINDNSIMDQMSEYVSGNAEYVVANINYRLLGDQNNTVTINEIVEDVFGAVLWVKDHIAEYNGDPNKVAVTGDSAGGHLTEMVVVAGGMLKSHGFTQSPYGFNPSYLPAVKTAEEVAAEGGLSVQAAIPSYGAFDMLAAAQGGFEKESNFFWQMGGAKARGLFGNDFNVTDHPEMYKAVSPAYLIPSSSGKKLPPQFFHVGSEDQTTPPVAVKAYFDQLKAKGHTAEYWLYEGRNHAYLDSGKNEFLGNSFEEDAIEPLNRMIKFLDSVFY
ncbi:carboxylesterase family protein [Roseivirga sp.]|uniref:carboxylesterase family protein n=1 Tax=Roseivirga sp. TaxID=1964215 RepID=UPI003B52E56F